MTTAVRMNDDFFDSLLSECEPTNDLGFSPFEFPISKGNEAYESPSISPTIVPPTISPQQTKTISGSIPEMKLERPTSPDSSALNPGSPTSSAPSKRSFDKMVEKTAGKATKGKKSNPNKKRKQEDRRERKNQREKQRRTELNALFDNMVDLLGLPKETKADKVTVLASAINTIRQLRSTIRPELLQLVQERNLFNVPVNETVEAAQQAVQKQQAQQAQPPMPSAPQPVSSYQSAPVAMPQHVYLPVSHAKPQHEPAPIQRAKPTIEDLTYFDPCSVFSDM